MDLGLANRAAIVAASSKGLGRAVAFGLAREGAKLALCARNESALNETAREILDTTGVEVIAQAVDVTSYDQVQRFVRQTHAQFGRIDICVTNAGGPPAKSFADTSVEDWRSAVDLNLLSTVFFAREVLPFMQRQKWGRFIAITSAAVRQPLDGLILSNSVRTAVNGLVKSLANEYGKYNVLVSNVCPGYTRTARLTSVAGRLAAAEGSSVEKIIERWTAQIPLQRLAEPEEFANAVVFLASERASYITGVTLPVDGGFIKGA